MDERKREIGEKETRERKRKKFWGEKERRKEKRRKATLEKGGGENNFPPLLPYLCTCARVGEKEGRRKESRVQERGFTHDGREICRMREMINCGREGERDQKREVEREIRREREIYII